MKIPRNKKGFTLLEIIIVIIIIGVLTSLDSFQSALAGEVKLKSEFLRGL